MANLPYDPQCDWFYRGREVGERKERERIIELLKPLGCEANGVEHDCQNGLGYTTAADLIALIKGEK